MAIRPPALGSSSTCLLQVDLRVLKELRGEPPPPPTLPPKHTHAQGSNTVSLTWGLSSLILLLPQAILVGVVLFFSTRGGKPSTASHRASAAASVPPPEPAPEATPDDVSGDAGVEEHKGQSPGEEEDVAEKADEAAEGTVETEVEKSGADDKVQSVATPSEPAVGLDRSVFDAYFVCTCSERDFQSRGRGGALEFLDCSPVVTPLVPGGYSWGYE